MSKNNIYTLLTLPAVFGTMANSYTDYIMLSNDKVLDYSISLVIEIDELLEKGYSKEEIADLIMNCDFTIKDSELTKEDNEHLKIYALRTLDIRYELYNEANVTRKLKNTSN